MAVSNITPNVPQKQEGQTLTNIEFNAVLGSFSSAQTELESLNTSIVNIELTPGPQGIQGNTGAQGIQGITGIQGPPGGIGPTGPQGVKGDTGNTGAQGPQGLQGAVGPQGDIGLTGATGLTGLNGLSAYQVAVANGYTGSESQWVDEFQTDFDANHFEVVDGKFQPKASGLLDKLQSIAGFDIYINQLIDAFVNSPGAASLDVVDIASSTFANVAPDDRGEYSVTFNSVLTGDYIVLLSNRPAGTGNLDVPSGWTQLFLNSQIQLLARERQSGDPLTYLFYKTVAPNLYAENGILALAVRGFEGAEIIGVTLGTNNIGQVGGIATVNEVTVPTGDEYLALAFVADQNDPTAPHDYSNDFVREARISKTAYDQVLSVASKTLPNGGASGSTTIASTGNPETIMLVLKKNKI